MNNIDISLLIAFTGVILTVILLFINKNIFFKQDNKDKLKKFIPIISVIILIGSVFIINYYYTKKLQNEKEFYENLLVKFNIENKNITNQNKNVAIDSLKIYKEKLNQFIENTEKQEKITGKNSGILKAAKSKLIDTDILIKKIKEYNEILNKDLLIKNRKGYMSVNSSNFEFYCPTDKFSEYIDLAISFSDKKLIQKIDYLMIEVSEIKNDSTYTFVFEELYKPQEGINAFRIKNYLKKPKLVLSIGYVLKSEKNKSYPNYESVNCYSYK